MALEVPNAGGGGGGAPARALCLWAAIVAEGVELVFRRFMKA